MKKMFLGLIILLISINVGAKSVDDIYNEVVDDDVFSINSYKPTLEGEDWIMDLDDYMRLFTKLKYPNENYLSIYIKDCNEDMSQCTISLIYSEDGIESHEEFLEREVKVKWVEESDEINEKINRVKSIVQENAHDHKDDTNNYYINDIDAFTFRSDGALSIVPFLDYSPELKSLINDSHVGIYSTISWGNQSEFYGYGGPKALITYDNIICGFIDFGFGVKNVVYVPDYTKDEPENLIDAVNKRVNNIGDIVIQKYDLRSNYKTDGGSDYDYDLVGNSDKMSEYYYRVETPNGEFMIVVEKNTNVNDPNHKTNDELFNEVAPNDIFTINAIKPTGNSESDYSEELYYYTTHYLHLKYPKNKYESFLDSCNNDLTECHLHIYNDEDVERKVKVVWAEDEENLKDKVDKYIKEIKSYRDKNGLANDMPNFELTDLNLINYMVNEMTFDSENYESQPGYSNNLKEMLENNNFNLYFYDRMGDDYPFQNYIGGPLIIMHNNIMYGEVTIGIQKKNVIYIPSDTPDNQEAYIAAAKKRIDNYLENTDTKIEVGGKIKEAIEGYINYNFGILGDESYIDDDYYIVTLKNTKDKFLIMKDDSKLENPKLESKDTKTNITVLIVGDSIPLDAIIKVEEILKGSTAFKKIVDKIKTETFMAFDITLNSETLGGPIKKLDNGKFRVTIPLGKDYVNKKMFAYFIKEDGSLEKYDIIMDENGNATFETAHFSTYIIAEELEEEKTNEEKLPDEVEKQVDETKEEEKTNEIVEEIDKVNETVPQTFDSITYYVISLIISVCTLTITILLRKRYN